jgi:hypothetical protein
MGIDMVMTGACRTYEFRLQIRRNRRKSSPIFVEHVFLFKMQDSTAGGQILADFLWGVWTVVRGCKSKFVLRCWKSATERHSDTIHTDYPPK